MILFQNTTFQTHVQNLLYLIFFLYKKMAIQLNIPKRELNDIHNATNKLFKINSSQK